MSSQKGSGLWYLKSFPALAKMFLEYEKYSGKDKYISDECRAELERFCAASSKTLKETGCDFCKEISNSKKIEIQDFWHICVCLSSSHGARNEQS